MHLDFHLRVEPSIKATALEAAVPSLIFRTYQIYLEKAYLVFPVTNVYAGSRGKQHRSSQFSVSNAGGSMGQSFCHHGSPVPADGAFFLPFIPQKQLNEHQLQKNLHLLQVHTPLHTVLHLKTCSSPSVSSLPLQCSYSATGL